MRVMAEVKQEIRSRARSDVTKFGKSCEVGSEVGRERFRREGAVAWTHVEVS